MGVNKRVWIKAHFSNAQGTIKNVLEEHGAEDRRVWSGSKNDLMAYRPDPALSRQDLRANGSTENNEKSLGSHDANNFFILRKIPRPWWRKSTLFS